MDGASTAFIDEKKVNYKGFTKIAGNIQFNKY